MRIAVASGKGGTGKTTVAISLAFLAAQRGEDVVYADCDVEEPNGHLFLRPEIEQQIPIEKPVPVVHMAQCTHCGRCAEACRYGAIASVPHATFVFAELCHGCGGCMLACPQKAIREQRRPIGILRSGRSGSIQYLAGALNVGEAMSPPAIRAVKAAIPPAELVILDAPPGTACPVVETLRGCDFVLLVTEPTPFGLHDLQLAVRLVQSLKLPMGVVINRARLGNGQLVQYLKQQRLPVLGSLPNSRRVAEAYSRGLIPAQAVPLFGKELQGVLEQLESMVVR